jgi:hypothetical protein
MSGQILPNVVAVNWAIHFGNVDISGRSTNAVQNLSLYYRLILWNRRLNSSPQYSLPSACNSSLHKDADFWQHVQKSNSIKALKRVDFWMHLKARLHGGISHGIDIPWFWVSPTDSPPFTREVPRTFCGTNWVPWDIPPCKRALTLLFHRHGWAPRGMQVMRHIHTLYVPWRKPPFAFRMRKVRLPPSPPPNVPAAAEKDFKKDGYLIHVLYFVLINTAPRLGYFLLHPYMHLV